MNETKDLLCSNFAHVNNSQIKISIIYNYFAKQSTVYKSLASIANQHLTLCSPSELEIIIVDDGTENENLTELPNNVIYLWQRKFGYGISRAKNTGAKIANGQFLVFLDPDIQVCPTYLETVLNGFARYGDRVVQCGYIWDYHFAGCPDPRTEFGVWENPDFLTQRFYQIAGGNLAISRRLFDETPGFDEDLIYGGVEDLLFGYQISRLTNTSVYFNRQLESWHIPHPPSLAHSNPAQSWEIVKRKYPEFYEQYVVRGLR